MTAPPHISIILPTCERPADLRRCLDTVRQLTYPAYDILVVDQSDDRQTEEIVKAVMNHLPNIRYMHAPKKGLSQARNLGLAAVEGEIIAFVDDDCTVEPHWLASVAQTFMQHPEAALVFGSVHSAIPMGTNFFIPVYNVKNLRVLRGRLAYLRTGGMGASMYLRRDAVEHIGLFDPYLGAGAHFSSYDDLDYSYRALAAGYAVVETPHIEVLHYGARDYKSGAASQLLRRAAHANGAMDMKLLRSGHLLALLLIAVHVWRNLTHISIRNMLQRQGPSGLAWITMYMRGLVDSFQLHVDSRRCIYCAPPYDKQSPVLTRQPRVLFFSNSFVMGGMELHLISLARGLIQRGVKVDLIYNENNEEAIMPMLVALRQDGVSIHPLDQRHGVLGFVQRLKNLYSVTRTIRPDVIHIHSTGPQRGELPLLAFKCARPTGCLLIRTDHNPPDGHPSRNDLLRLHLRDLILDRIIVVSHQNRLMHLRELGRSPRKVLTIHNGIDTTIPVAIPRATVRAEWGVPSSAIVVGMVSRLDEHRKGGDVFLHSIARARVHCADIHYVIIGDGVLRADYERLAADLGIAAYGRFLGHRTDVTDQLAGIDIFFLPSRYEGLPYTLLEALRSGKPSVATNVGGVEDVLCDGRNTYGLIIPPDDADSAAHALVHLATHPDVRAYLAHSGPQRIANHFSIDSMVAKLMQVYGFDAQQRYEPTLYAVSPP